MSLLFSRGSLSCFRHAHNLTRHTVTRPLTARLYSSEKPSEEEGKPDKISRPMVFGDSRKDPMEGKGPINAKSAALTAAIFAVLYGGYYLMREKMEKQEAVKKSKIHGKALIGGPWKLTDHHGKVRSNEDFKGKWLMIYFGFTHCPDICPDEIEKMVAAADLVKKRTRNKDIIQPIFISVDPKRDGVKEVKEYVEEFHKDLLGFTGPEEDVLDVCRQYRVYYSAGPRDQDDDYIVDHTIITYLMDPDGEFVDYFGQTKKVQQLTESIMSAMMAYNDKKK